MQFRAQQEQFERLFEESFSNFQGEESFSNFQGDASWQWEPRIVGHVLPAGQVLFPFAPIIVSLDRSHFALVNADCSIGVYKGSVQPLIRHLMRSSNPPDMTDFDYAFRSPGDPSLGGNCFAGLDGAGVLHVFAGHPDLDFTPIWETATQNDDFPTRFSRYYLELTDTGELAVLKLEPGDPEASCVWSSFSCDIYVALLLEARIELIRTFRSSIRSFARWVKWLQGYEPIQLVWERIKRLIGTLFHE